MSLNPGYSSVRLCQFMDDSRKLMKLLIVKSREYLSQLWPLCPTVFPCLGVTEEYFLMGQNMQQNMTELCLNCLFAQK